MNIYDFDETIFDGDSSVCFIKYSLCHHPGKVLIAFFKSLGKMIKKILGKSSFGEVKGALFSFVKDIKDFDDYMDKYVAKYVHRIKPYYFNNQKESDVIISASFEFIVKPLCDKLNIKNVIATKYDVKTGNIIGENCKSEEKVKRFREVYKKAEVLEAYSDSLTDVPMLKLAKKAYLVKGYELVPFEE